MTATTLAWMLTAHFVGDFLLQSDWMATNKSKRLDALAFHAGCYSVCFLPWGPWFAIATFGLHFAQDAITSRITSRLWFIRTTPAVKGWRELSEEVATEQTAYWIDWLPTRHRFFVAIGADQLLHYWLLIWTWHLMN